MGGRPCRGGDDSGRRPTRTPRRPPPRGSSLGLAVQLTGCTEAVVAAADGPASRACAQIAPPAFGQRRTSPFRAWRPAPYPDGVRCRRLPVGGGVGSAAGRFPAFGDDLEPLHVARFLLE